MIGVFESFGVIQPLGVLGGGVIASNEEGPVDPLAGIPFIGRWEPGLSEFYRDVAMTDPATAEDDMIAAWHDPVNNLTFAQEVEASRPTLQFVNGLPVAYFNDTQHMKLEGIEALIPTAGMLAVWFRLDTDTGYQIVSTVDDALDRFADNGFQYPGLFINPRVNTYRAAMPTTGDHTLTTKATALTFENWLDGVSGGEVIAIYGFSRTFIRLGGGGSSPGGMTGPVGSVYLNNVWTTEQRVLIESHQVSQFTP
jgi:hypothetical protein